MGMKTYYSPLNLWYDRSKTKFSENEMKKKKPNSKADEKSPKKTARHQKPDGKRKAKEPEAGKKKKKAKKEPEKKASEKPSLTKKEMKAKERALDRRILSLFDSCATLYIRKKESPVTVRGLPLTPSEIHTLTAVKEREPATLTALSEALGITKTGASKNAGKLIEKGLAEKEILSRCVLYTLTDKGEALLTNLPDAQALVFIRYTEAVRLETASADKERAAQFLERIERALSDET